MKFSKELYEVIRNNEYATTTFVINEDGYFKRYNVVEIIRALLDEIERLNSEISRLVSREEEK